MFQRNQDLWAMKCYCTMLLEWNPLNDRQRKEIQNIKTLLIAVCTKNSLSISAEDSIRSIPCFTRPNFNLVSLYQTVLVGINIVFNESKCSFYLMCPGLDWVLLCKFWWGNSVPKNFQDITNSHLMHFCTEVDQFFGGLHLWREGSCLHWCEDLQ